LCRCAGAALFLAVMLVGCAGPAPTPTPESSFTTTLPPTVRGTAYTVRAGDTLYSIARRHGLDWHALVEANPSLQSMAELQPGQIIIIPSEGAGASGGQAAESGMPGPAATRNPGYASPIPAEPNFIWPLRGEIIARFGQSGSGVDIRAGAGQTVVAAKSGRVNVFEKAPEYGKVIVLEHQDGSATYYGRLGEILVAHGAWVKQGEAIATAGSSGGNGAELQFRVMENDQFVDPLRVLPR
jgi:murein DD-endopeptidase MepM/ murein hydrolase activator NlpD